MNSSQRPILVFVSIAYGLSIGLSLLIGLTGGHGSRWLGFGYLSMLIPAVSVFITMAVVRDEPRTVGSNRLPLRYVPAALLLMPAVLHTTDVLRNSAGAIQQGAGANRDGLGAGRRETGDGRRDAA